MDLHHPSVPRSTDQHSTLRHERFVFRAEGLGRLNADRGVLIANSGSGLDCGFVDQHDWDVVLYPIDTVTVGTLQTFWILSILERLLAGGTNQDVEEIFGKHDGGIVRPSVA